MRSTPTQIKSDLSAACKATETSPTPAQIKSGNYAKGKLTIHGLLIALENPKGSVRSGTDRKGRKWSVTMKSDYGYIRRAGSEVVGKGKDGDHVDVLIGPRPESELVYIINQINPDSGRFDEHKCVLGATNETEARETYLANYERGWKGLGEIQAMPIEQFKAWLTQGNLKKPAPELHFSAASSRSETMPNPQDAEVERLMQQEKAQAMARGLDEATAAQFAGRMLNLRGWYKTRDGWKRLSPDVRQKVNVRFAEQQPDGRYFVPDVDVFYPNAVKAGEDGKPAVFSAGRIERIIGNTNQALESGAPKPPVTKVHITPNTKALGVHIPSFGEALNFRPSPKAGWMRCDILVTPEMFSDWRDRRISHLSAAVVPDAAGLNERVGHVMIGTPAQALSRLPATEIFGVQNQLCFSADEADFTPRRAKKESHMPYNFTTEHCGQLKNAFSALSAAYASAEAGEEGAESKIEEAEQGLTKLQEDLQAAEDAVKGEGEGAGEGGEQGVEAAATDEKSDGTLGDPAGTGQPNPQPEKKPDEFGALGNAAQAAVAAKSDAAGWDRGKKPLYKHPKGAHWPPTLGNKARVVHQGHYHSAEEFAADPAGAFEALSKQVQELAQSNANLTKANADLSAKAARESFQAFCSEHGELEFDAAEALADFDAADGNPKMIERIKARVLKSKPRPQSPARMGQVFSAGEGGKRLEDKPAAGKDGKAKDIDKTIAAMRAMNDGTGMTFSADDIMVAERINQKMAKMVAAQ